jgi:hypothetical protein
LDGALEDEHCVMFASVEFHDERLGIKLCQHSLNGLPALQEHLYWLVHVAV